MPDDDRLAISVTHADGRVTRWGYDAVDAGAVPSGLRFSSSVPGGYKDLTCSLLRDLEPRSDEALYDDVRVYGPGNETVWQGRMAQLPRSNRRLTPGAIGWSAHLEDDPTFREVYVDRDVTRWREPAIETQRVAYLTTDGLGTHVDAGTDLDGSIYVPAIRQSIQPPCSAFATRHAWYGNGVIPLGSIYYEWASNPTDTNLDSTQATWFWQVYAPSSTTAWTDTTGDLQASSGGLATGTGTWTLPTIRPYLMLAFGRDTALTAGGTREHALVWRRLAVFGAHTLTKRGGAPDQGFYASDIVADVVARAAPLLRFTTGTDGTIQQTTFVIPHAVFDEPTTAADVISRINAYELREWAVWNDRTFYYVPPTPRVIWNARIADGAQLDLEGDQASDVYNGVFVTYTDALGDRKTVGPPGALADATDAALADTNEANPVNAHGIPRRWARLDLSTPTTQAGATQIGAVYLAELSYAKRRGSMTLTGFCTKDGQSGRYPVSRIRAGDFVTVVDRPDEPLRRIVEVDYDHSSRTARLALDSSSNRLEAILERIGIVLKGVV